MLRWHPDKNFGDDENSKEIAIAYEILKDEEKRARYNNEADYDNGWLSLKRWKVILWPECVTEERKEAYWHRMVMSALSLRIMIGGGKLMSRQILTDLTPAKNLQFYDKKSASVGQP